LLPMLCSRFDSSTPSFLFFFAVNALCALFLSLFYT
jgi:hypothetical protein